MIILKGHKKETALLRKLNSMARVFGFTLEMAENIECKNCTTLEDYNIELALRLQEQCEEKETTITGLKERITELESDLVNAKNTPKESKPKKPANKAE